MSNSIKEIPNTNNQLRDEIEDSYEDTNRPYGGYEGCWPGDGSGMDDFADYNALEDQGW
jgi:hypothetical protein